MNHLSLTSLRELGLSELIHPIIPPSLNPQTQKVRENMRTKAMELIQERSPDIGKLLVQYWDILATHIPLNCGRIEFILEKEQLEFHYTTGNPQFPNDHTRQLIKFFVFDIRSRLLERKPDIRYRPTPYNLGDY